MTSEIEYIGIGNLQKLRMARLIVNDVLAGEKYGVDQKELAKLADALDRLIAKANSRIVLVQE